MGKHLGNGGVVKKLLNVNVKPHIEAKHSKGPVVKETVQTW
jgi:hypothetical protein